MKGTKLAALFMCAALGAAGCKKEEAVETSKAKEAPKTTVAAKPPEPAKPDIAKRMQECTSAADPAKVPDCYAADAKVELVDSGMPAAEGPAKIAEFYSTFGKAFPDMKMQPAGAWISGNWTAGAMSMSGTNTGELMGMPPTGNKVILNGFMIQEWNAEGKIKNEWHFADQMAMHMQLHPDPKMMKMMPQMPPPSALEPITAGPVIAANDQKEKDNLAKQNAMNDAYVKGDVAGVQADVTDDFTTHDMGMTTKGKAENEKMMKEGFGAFSENKMTPVAQFAAGDYVIQASTWEAKNTGDMPSMKMKATNKPVKLTQAMVTRWEGGKAKEMWFFANGAAMAQQLGMMPPHDAAKPGQPAKPQK